MDLGGLSDCSMADSLHGVPRSPRTEGRSHQSPWPNEQRSTADRPVYIYKLPYCTYYQLCRYLDADRKWDMLAGLMEMDPVDIKLFSNATLRGGSPADEVLKKFGERNGRISQVFRYLYKMQYFKGMHILQEYVDPKYWYLLDSQQGKGNDSSALISPFTDQPSAPPYESAQASLNLQSSRYMNALDSVSRVHRSPKLVSRTGVPHNGSRMPASQAARYPPSSAVGAVGGASSVNNANDRLQEQLLSSGVKILSLRSHTRQNDPRVIKFHNVNVNAEINFKDIDLEPIKHIPYAELATATENFADCNILGRGGFGTVYRGAWKDVTVAVKKLHLSTQSDSREHEREAAPLVPVKVDEKEKKRKAEEERLRIKSMLTELRVLEKCRFPNILALYGVSVDNPNRPCIVYEYMPGGSLDDRLKRKDHYAALPPLCWHQRASIARGTARGLNYLHTIQENQPLVHGDVKPANILLDGNLQPKLGDFGLTREGPEGECTHRAVSRLQGTKLYLPHEYLQSRHLSTKVDVYSFGLVLLELATNLRIFDDNRKHRFLSAHIHALRTVGRHLEAKDPAGGEEPGSNDLVELFINLGLRCSADKKKCRPEMAEVLEALREATFAYKSPQLMPRRYSRDATTALQQQLAVMVGSSPPANIALAVPNNLRRLSPSDNMQVGPSSPVPATGTTGTANIGSVFQQQQLSPQTAALKPQNIQLQQQQQGLIQQEQQRKMQLTQQYLLSLQQAQQHLLPPAALNRLTEQPQVRVGTDGQCAGAQGYAVVQQSAGGNQHPERLAKPNSDGHLPQQVANAGTSEALIPDLPLLYQGEAEDLPLVSLLGFSETTNTAAKSTSISNLKSTSSGSNPSGDISPN